jgi:hypothetical protein
MLLGSIPRFFFFFFCFLLLLRMLSACKPR